MDSGKALTFSGASEVKYADAASGGEGINDGCVDQRRQKCEADEPNDHFKNQASSYPARGAPGSAPGARYRAAKKGFFNQYLLKEWLKEPLSWGPRGGIARSFADEQGSRALWMGNCSSRSGGDAIAASVGAKIKFFPPSATDLCQPADSSVISKIKEIRRSKWEKHKLQAIKSGDFSMPAAAGQGK